MGCEPGRGGCAGSHRWSLSSSGWASRFSCRSSSSRCRKRGNQLAPTCWDGKALSTLAEALVKGWENWRVQEQQQEQQQQREVDLHLHPATWRWDRNHVSDGASPGRLCSSGPEFRASDGDHNPLLSANPFFVVPTSNHTCSRCGPWPLGPGPKTTHFRGAFDGEYRRLGTDWSSFSHLQRPRHQVPVLQAQP